MKLQTDFHIAKSFLENAAAFSASKVCFEKGDFFRLPLPFQNVYMVNDAEVLHHILVKSEEKYIKSKIYWQQLKAIVGEAMGTLEGDSWLTVRKIQNSFFTKTAVETYLEDLAKETDIFTDNLASNSDKNTFFSPMAETSLLNVKLILRYIFGVETDFDVKKFYHYIENGEDLIAWRSKFPLREYFSKFTKRHKIANESLIFLSEWTNGIIQNKIQKNSQNIDNQQSNQKNKIPYLDLVETLLAHNYNAKHIRNELIIHLGAGTETLAVANTWTLYLLSQNPIILEKTKQEILSITKNNKIQVAHIKQFTYLEQVIQESLRLFPPSHALVRDAITKDKILNTNIKKNDIFYISAYGIHRNPKYWENPDAFIPERFDKENSEKIKNHTYVPFGAGKHTCIGKYLATPAMILMLANIIQKYDFKLQNIGLIAPVSLSTLKPNQELTFSLTSNLTTRL